RSLLAEKAREMAGHRRVGGIRQTELLQPRRSSPRGHVLGAHGREKAVEQHLIQIFAPQRRADRPANEPGAFAEDSHWMLGALGLRIERLLRHAALVPQRMQLPGVDAMTVALEPLPDQT